MDFIEFLLDPTAHSTNAAATGTALDICGANSNLLWIVQLARIVIRIIAIAAPFALIIFGSLDFFKAIIAGDEKEMKAKRKPFIGRLVAAIIILLMPTIVNLIMKTVAKKTNNNFATCWNAASNNGWSLNLPEIDDDWEPSN